MPRSNFILHSLPNAAIWDTNNSALANSRIASCNEFEIPCPDPFSNANLCSSLANKPSAVDVVHERLYTIKPFVIPQALAVVAYKTHAIRNIFERRLQPYNHGSAFK